MKPEKTKSLHIDVKTHLRLKIYSAIEKIPINQAANEFIKQCLDDADKSRPYEH
jgi:hypothetical protein